MNTSALGSSGSPEVPCLPPTYEEALLRALSERTRGSGALFEQMLSQGLKMSLFVQGETRKVTVVFNPVSGRLMIHDPMAPDQQWKWRRLRRLVLRDILLQTLSKTGGDLHDAYPHLTGALQFPRPQVSRTGDALDTILKRVEARLTISETATFDRRLFPLVETLETGARTQLRDDVREALARLTEDQIVAIAQDDVSLGDAPMNQAVVFPISEQEELVRLAREVNSGSSPVVSLAIPAQAVLVVEIGAGMSREEKIVEIMLIYPELSSSGAMHVLRESPLVGLATDVLDANGLSLDELVIRESQADSREMPE